ncbi:MAG: hypothetical protein ACOYLX_21150, partial [Burkholderiaceae bacterium]
MTRRRTVWVVVVAMAVLVTLVWANRLVVLRYSLGWYTDLMHPRDANRPVPWQEGPPSANAPPSARPPNIVVILADD